MYNSSLTRLEFEIIAFFVSHKNHCHWWIDKHEKNLREEIEKKYNQYVENLILFEYDNNDKEIIHAIKNNSIFEHPKKDDLIHTISFMEYINSLVKYYNLG